MTQTAGYRLVRAPVRAPAAPQLDASQQAVVDHRSGPLLVLAGPGTGKTTTLVEAVAARIDEGSSPEDVLVLTFSRKAADELRERIALRIGRTVAEPAAYTFHGFCYAILRRAAVRDGLAPPRLLSGAERETRVRELLVGNAAGEGTTRWPAELVPALCLRGFAREVADLLDRARERGVDAIELQRLGARSQRPSWVAAGQFFDEYVEVLEAREEIDYAGLVIGAIAELTAAGVPDRPSYSAVYVDEYQDTDPAQVQLLRLLRPSLGPMVVVGDPDQSIYAFRGADVRGILGFPEDFASGDAAADVASLTTCRRSGQELLDVSRRVATGIPLGKLGRLTAEHRELTSAGPAAQMKPEIRLYSSAVAEAAGIADVLRRAHLEQGVPWSQMAVLVRSAVRSVPSLRRALVAAGVPVAVAADELPLAQEPVVAPLLAALRYVADRREQRRTGRVAALTPDAARALLVSPLGGATTTQLRALGRRLRAFARAAGLKQPPPSEELIRNAVMDPRDLGTIEDWVAAPVRRLADVLAAAEQAEAAGSTPEEIVWTLWDGSGWSHRATRRLTDPELNLPAVQSAHRDIDAVLALFAVASRLQDRQPKVGVAGLLDEVEAQEIPAAPDEERPTPGGAVRLLTAHRSKGLEWDLVVVAGVQENVWPDLRRRGSLLGADSIDVGEARPAVSPAELLADERRLFYVALTRARRRLLITAVSAVDDAGDRPSRFLGETGPDVPQRVQRQSGVLSAPSLVARLRRTTESATVADTERRAAARQLAALADASDADGRPLVPAADPVAWWGTAPPTEGPRPVRPLDQPVALSGSAVASFTTCPRAWFLDREVKARETTSASQGFGSVVHALAEAVATESLPPELDRLTQRLDEVWPALPFDAAYQRIRERLAAIDALDRFLHWQAQNPRTFVAAEQAFEVALTDDVILRGRADRLELDDEGRCVVVDLKTSKHPSSQEALGTEPQLGVYQLAARQGAFGAELAEPGGAELLQLRSDSKRGLAKVQGQSALEPGDSWADDVVLDVAARIRAEAFPARPNQRCDRCSFRTSCPARDEGEQVVS